MRLHCLHGISCHRPPQGRWVPYCWRYLLGIHGLGRLHTARPSCASQLSAPSCTPQKTPFSWRAISKDHSFLKSIETVWNVAVTKYRAPSRLNEIVGIFCNRLSPVLLLQPAPERADLLVERICRADCRAQPVTQDVSNCALVVSNPSWTPVPATMRPFRMASSVRHRDWPGIPIGPRDVPEEVRNSLFLASDRAASRHGADYINDYGTMVTLHVTS